MQNDSHKSLEKFIELETNNQLEYAKTNLQNYDFDLQIDLKTFKNSQEFRDHLHKRDEFVDKSEAIFIGWFFTFLVEISMICSALLTFIFKKNETIRL